MKRNISQVLSAWAQRTNTKPLVLIGARQVGKTWLMRSVGSDHFQETVYINFERNPEMGSAFGANLDPHRIIAALELFTQKRIEPGRTLLIFDEIQEAPAAMTSLKYFAEELSELHIMAAGSLLGVGKGTRDSFPVGKVEIHRVYPMDFGEFLVAVGEDRMFDSLEAADWDLVALVHERCIQWLRAYFIVGGMPEVVQLFVNRGEWGEIRELQGQIQRAIDRDFSTHCPPRELPRLRAVWSNLPAQLARENKKFLYGLIRKGARAKDFEGSIDWLVNYGVVHQVLRYSKIGHPLSASTQTKHFKLYAHDIGLLGAQAGLSPSTAAHGDALFQEFKGALTEQFVLQQLAANQIPSLGYWSNDAGESEVDFLFELDGSTTALEVKAAENLRSKSLRTFHQLNPTARCLRTSLSPYRKETWLTNLPLYALGIAPMG